MAGVSVKMGVTGVSEFKRGMNEAKESVKTLNEALKLNENQLKLNGNQEIYLANKVQLLKDKIAAQTEVVKQAEAALEAMKKSGTEEASKSFQQMKQNVYKATSELLSMKAELKNVETGADKAGDETKEMNDQLGNIGKGVSWENVTNGLDNVISKLESGAKAAINLGKKIISSAKGSTGWADDLITLSQKTGFDVVELQKMEHAADFVDTEVDTILGAMQKMKKATQTSGGKTALEEVLGISLNGQTADDLFWEIGEALVNMGEAFDKEAAAQTVFGKNWQDLLPLFLKGRKEYEEMLDQQTYLTEEQVDKLGKADDAIKQVEQQIQDLKNAFWAENADKITELMQWIVDNKDGVVAALTAIAGGFGALKLGSFVLNLQKTIDGFSKLGLLKGGASAASGAAGGVPGVGIGMSGIVGLGGAALIGAGFAWAADRRKNHAEEVRGTEEYLANQAAGSETVLAEYIKAQDEMSKLDFSATEAQVDELQTKIDSLHSQLQEMEGGQDALKAYSDWRQEHSYGNEDWVMPEYLEQMTSLANQTTQASQTIQQNSLTSTDIQNFNSLPGQVAAAVQSAISHINIVINQSAVDTIGRRVGSNVGNTVKALTKGP